MGDTVDFVQMRLERRVKAGRSHRAGTQEEGHSRRQKVQGVSGTVAAAFHP